MNQEFHCKAYRLEDDGDRNRLKVSIYFYVQGVPEPVVVETYLQRLR
jgi:hypothetical protein